MTKKKSFFLGLLASNRVLTAVGQANFTMVGFTDFLSKRFQIPDFSFHAAIPLFLLTSLPRALVTGVSQGFAMTKAKDSTQEDKIQNLRLAGFDRPKRAAYAISKILPAISILFSGISTYKFVSIFCEKIGLLFHFNIWENPFSFFLVTSCTLFSSLCSMLAYYAYTYDQAKKGSAKLLSGEWKNYGWGTWVVTLIHILGRAVFAKYTISETFKYSNLDFLRIVLPNISAVAALGTDFLSNIHTIHDLNASLKSNWRKTLLPDLHGHVTPWQKNICHFTLVLGLLDSFYYGCGTLMTGTKALGNLTSAYGFSLVLAIFAPVSLFVNYAFNVRKGVANYLESLAPPAASAEDLEVSKIPSTNVLNLSPNSLRGESKV